MIALLSWSLEELGTQEWATGPDSGTNWKILLDQISEFGIMM